MDSRRRYVFPRTGVRGVNANTRTHIVARVVDYLPDAYVAVCRKFVRGSPVTNVSPKYPLCPRCVQYDGE